MEPRTIHPRPGRRAPVDPVRLRAAIAGSRLSIREVARRSGMTAAHLDGVLTAKHGISPAKLRQVTAELQVPYASVLTEDAAA